MDHSRPLFALSSFFPSPLYTIKIVDFSGIQARIIGVDGEHADHLTTTMYLQISSFFNRFSFTCSSSSETTHRPQRQRSATRLNDRPIQRGRVRQDHVHVRQRRWEQTARISGLWPFSASFYNMRLFLMIFVFHHVHVRQRRWASRHPHQRNPEFSAPGLSRPLFKNMGLSRPLFSWFSSFLHHTSISNWKKRRLFELGTTWW